jgi:hypothetical protein
MEASERFYPVRRPLAAFCAGAGWPCSVGLLDLGAQSSGCRF